MAEEPALLASGVISQKRQVPLGELALFFLRLAARGASLIPGAKKIT